MMEQGKDFSSRPCSRKPYLKTRSKDGRMKTTFRTAARQIWIANSFSKPHHVGVEPSKNSEVNQKMLNGSMLESNPSTPSRPQSIKRRATPDIFPMSSEMRKTLVLLGNLDLLPEEEKQKQDELIQAENKKKLNSFRQKAQMRVIQPQRFLRSFRGAKNAEKSTSEPENINSTAETLINSRTSNSTSTLSAKDEHLFMDKNNELVKLENVPSEDKDESKEPREDKNNSTFFITSPREQKRSGRNAWQKAIKRHQHGQVVPNPCNPFFVRKRFHQTRKEHFSKSWQPRANNFHEKFPTITRTYSLGSSRRSTSEPANLNLDIGNCAESINDGKTIAEIANDIQERCSKWFEFREKILTSRTNKLI